MKCDMLHRDIQDAKQNLLYAMDYLFDVEKYPYINDKMIDDLVNTAQMHIYCKMIGYTSMSGLCLVLK